MKVTEIPGPGGRVGIGSIGFKVTLNGKTIAIMAMKSSQWTATEVDEDHAFIIVYDGKVWPREKQFSPAYLGFRCVRQPAQ